MSEVTLTELAARVAKGDLVPYLGPGVLADVTDVEKGDPIPADSDSLIIAMNNGRPMAPKLMYEFPRAAMNIELKRGRNAINRFLTDTYSKRQWTRSALHDWLKEVKPAYTIDINRDLQLQESYSDTPHLLIRGIARIGGTEFRFHIHQYDGEKYTQVEWDEADTSLPILFKPMGSPVPEPLYIASDADYVDYITELMGGFGIPKFVKEKRVGMQYLLIGMRLNRDTERMVFSDITYAAAEPRGWVLIEEPTAKEERYCAKIGLEIVRASTTDLLAAAGMMAEA